MLEKKSRFFPQIVGNNRGMSIIEILIAITLIGLAGTFVVGKIFDNLKEGQVSSTKIQMKHLGDRLQEFRRHCGTFPTAEQGGMDSLVNKPSGGKECKRYQPGGYLQDGKVPLDPWDNEFIYTSDGKTYQIKSLGADGAEGGEGFDADLESDKL
ncbi:MAG: type II secretion system major pseudopilin GspG [Bacteriovoracaceae bacterium]